MYTHALLHDCFDCWRYVITRIWLHCMAPTWRIFVREKQMRLVNCFHLLLDDLDGMFDVHSSRGTVVVNDFLHLEAILGQSLINASLKLLFTSGAASFYLRYTFLPFSNLLKMTASSSSICFGSCFNLRSSTADIYVSMRSPLFAQCSASIMSSSTALHIYWASFSRPISAPNSRSSYSSIQSVSVSVGILVINTSPERR